MEREGVAPAGVEVPVVEQAVVQRLRVLREPARATAATWALGWSAPQVRRAFPKSASTARRGSGLCFPYGVQLRSAWNPPNARSTRSEASRHTVPAGHTLLTSHARKQVRPVPVLGACSVPHTPLRHSESPVHAVGASKSPLVLGPRQRSS
jgi:hypothetical protein